ncbi:uncharacterized protein N7483_011535 [Penicillium malachiteum]|uniref:uncharacterized protein n=1 Tax=Penicillium malachiteum TaxID=1324776 RepID=UPI0025472E63|nr:uncharacterized protein N7483_011535 [Penicillium malachiteum]KAJ5714354.1 hypothetical protein N7483_011535 [Penicillium malachiteum]
MSSEQKQEQPKSVADQSTKQNTLPSDLQVTTVETISIKPTKRSIQAVREVEHFKSENTVVRISPFFISYETANTDSFVFCKDTSVMVPESLMPGEEEEVVLDSF